MVADLPWADYTVRLQLQVHKYYCDNSSCRRQIFCERLPTVVAPWARRTSRLAARQHRLGLALGGNAGARLSPALGCPVSRNTLLRLLRRGARPELPTPRVLGVDDWAQRKGQTYRTVLIDMERHHAVALLPDREAATFAAWLQNHPGVEIVCRDRFEAYAQGARTGASGALQVADRFHLLKNLAEALLHVFEQYAAELKTVIAAHRKLPPPLSELTVTNTPTAQSQEALPLPLAPPSEAAQAREVRHQQRYEEIRQLREAGWTFQAIGAHLGVSRCTAARYALAPHCPPRRLRHTPLDDYKPYLLARWNAGCRTGVQLFTEIQHQGYRGKRSTVLNYITRLRKAQGLAPRSRRLTPTRPVSDPAIHPLTPRRATWLVLQRPEKSTVCELAFIIQLQQTHPVLATAITLAQQFVHALRVRSPALFDQWLLAALASEVAALQRFAQSLQRDYAAVKAGFTVPWSTGPVEGHINRLKMLKRQMFGRANLDLLAIRMLHAP